LEYFWDQQESGNLENYEGGFKSLKKVEVEDVLESNLPEMTNMIAHSSNEINQSLENLRQDLSAINQQLGIAAMNNQTSGLQTSINDLYRLIGELRGQMNT
jgi:hypothetical protein